MLLADSFCRWLLAAIVAPSIVFGAAVLAGAQTPSPAANAMAKRVVKSADDLPRFTYPIDGSASALVQADAPAFNAFAANVKANIDSVLAGYDIQDRGTLRGLLQTNLTIDLLAGVPAATISAELDRIRELEDKPDAKLLSGVRTRAMLAARTDAGAASGPAFQAAFRQRYQTAIAALPWPIVGTAVKESKVAYEITTPAVIVGRIQGSIDPALATSHALSDATAAAVIASRFALDEIVPIKAAGAAALGAVIAANTTVKPNIWPARDATLTTQQKLTPVAMGVWDSGVDLSLYPHQRSTAPGFAYDLLGMPTTGVLYPLPADKRAIYAQFVTYFEGLSDLQASIDSPSATAVKQRISTLPQADVPAFFEDLKLFGNYSHGTHVAGLTVRGNPAARIVVGRITYDYKTIPTPPTDAIMQAVGKSYPDAVAYFRAHRVRVVNMSWGDSPSEFEGVLEKNGIGRDATERKALARRYYLVERNALYAALTSAPEILFVCSAGNSNADSSFDETIPSGFDLPNLLVVGAVDQAGDETSFTSYGKTVSVDANGYHVPSYVPGGAVVQLSGTSMASPNTANLAGKLLALDPALTPVQVIGLIRKGATPTPDGRRHLIDEKKSLALLAAMRAHRMAQR